MIFAAMEKEKKIKEERVMPALREAATLQESYKKLCAQKRLTKKAICELCVPFRDKYGLTGLQTLKIARNELSLSELLDLLENKKE